jgi:hypothetical protein
MATNRTFPNVWITACITALALCASGATAQTIYKQVDEDGRVSFTDQPKSTARVVASYNTGAPATARADTAARHEVPSRSDVSAESAEAPRRFSGEFSVRPIDIRPGAGEIAPRPVADQPRGADVALRPAAEPGQELSGATSPAANTPRQRYGEIERAVANYTPLNSPLAAQVDATESARRARQESTKTAKEASHPVLVVQRAAPDHDRIARQDQLSFFYALWVITFSLLGAGLLYFGWRVLSLILGGAFPNWHVGAG